MNVVFMSVLHFSFVLHVWTTPVYLHACFNEML